MHNVRKIKQNFFIIIFFLWGGVPPPRAVWRPRQAALVFTLSYTLFNTFQSPAYTYNLLVVLSDYHVLAAAVARIYGSATRAFSVAGPTVQLLYYNVWGRALLNLYRFHAGLDNTCSFDITLRSVSNLAQYKLTLRPTCFIYLLNLLSFLWELATKLCACVVTASSQAASSPRSARQLGVASLAVSLIGVLIGIIIIIVFVVIYFAVGVEFVKSHTYESVDTIQAVNYPLLSTIYSHCRLHHYKHATYQVGRIKQCQRSLVLLTTTPE